MSDTASAMQTPQGTTDAAPDPNHFVAIYNPAAGGGRCGKRAPDAFARLRGMGLTLDIRETRAAGHGQELAREAYAAGHRNFIAVGGDGTSYEIVNGLFSPAREGDEMPALAGPPPRLGFLPMGTGNSFLRDFSEEGADYAIQCLCDARSRPCDVIRVHHTRGVVHFINIFSVGFVADVGALRNRRFSALGEFGYIVAVVAQVIGLQAKAFPITVDGTTDREPVTFLSINNSKFTGGKMRMAPDADTADGKLDLIRVGRMNRRSLLATFPKIFSGTHVEHPAVTTGQAAALDFHVDQDLDVMIDGEMIQITPTRLEVLPSALAVVA